MPSPAAAPLRPDALTPAALAALLTAQGLGAVTEAQVCGWLAGGGPQNADGTLNLMDVAAWLTKSIQDGR